MHGQPADALTDGQAVEHLGAEAGHARVAHDCDAAVFVVEVVAVEAVRALGHDDVMAEAVPVVAGDGDLEDVARAYELDRHARSIFGSEHPQLARRRRVAGQAAVRPQPVQDVRDRVAEVGREPRQLHARRLLGPGRDLDLDPNAR